MTIETTVYDRLPNTVKPLAKQLYHGVTRLANPSEQSNWCLRRTNEQFHDHFVSAFFESRAEYDDYVYEFEHGAAVEAWHDALDRYSELTDDFDMGTVSMDTARDYYALTRKLEPAVTVETGVCNGLSTMAVLLALRENGDGVLYSIDYPFRADESLEEFRTETFDEYGGAAIPSDKDPGWVIPDAIRDNWELRIGKSQRELPRLLAEIGEMDVFVHDSEHSHPCMMFEYELAYEWLADGGVILSDDITWNDAFTVFTDVRDPEWGKLRRNVGYMRKH